MYRVDQVRRKVLPGDLFVNKLGQYEDRPCLFVPNGDSLSYRDLMREASGVAQALGDRRQLIFIEGHNSTAAITAYVGCLQGGHVAHVLNPDKEVENGELVKTFRPNKIIRNSKSVWELEKIHDEPIDLHPDLCILLSTSGSTGSSKLVKLSYENIQSNTESIVEYLQMNQDDRAITSLPFHYSYGMSIINSHLAVGASIVLTDLSIQQSKFWEIFATYKVTSLSGVPYSFQMLDQLDVDFSAFSHLRRVTQAGGRLAPDLVRKYARLGAGQGWPFYVMYGQTEASPRMSYLPPDLAEDNADCIGVAIPDGHLAVVDDDDEVINEPGREGELVYSGPNVMIGYAYTNGDLAAAEDIKLLHTGDLAERNQQGLFKIVGRKSRFVKPFGVRLSLDDVEIFLNSLNVHATVVGVNDEIVSFIEDPTCKDDIPVWLSEKYDFPSYIFHTVVLDSLPLLPNGKPDYRALENSFRALKSGLPEDRGSFWWRFIKEAFLEFCTILLGRGSKWTSVEEIFAVCFPKSRVSPDQSFISLGGDSLLHVEMSICLEDYLETLPSDWYNWSIRELQALRGLQGG